MKSTLFQWRSLKTRITIFTLCIFVISIWSLAFFANRMLRENLQNLVEQQQTSTVTIVAAEVNQEVGDRLQALEKVAGEVSPFMLAHAAALQNFLDDRPVFQGLFNAGTFVTRADGVAVAALPRSIARIGDSFMDRESVRTALQEGRSVMGKPHPGYLLKGPVLASAAPIRDGQGKVIGALVGVINLGEPNFLDRITGNGYGKTGGYLVVAKQHRLIVAATDRSRILEALPAPGRIPLVDRYVLGYEGPGLAVTPKGVPMLAAAAGIPAAGWYAVVLLPIAEAFAPIDDIQRSLMLATVLITLLASGMTWRMLQLQFAALTVTAKELATLPSSNRFPQALNIVRDDEIGDLIAGFNHLLGALQLRENLLSESEQRFRTLIEWTPVAFAVHRAGKILYFNPAALTMFGAVDANDIVGKPILDFIHPDDRALVVARVRRSEEAGIDPPRNEERFLRLDGTTMDVEVQGKSILYDGERATQVVMRDITESKQNQQRLERLLAEQKAMLESDLIGILKLRHRTVQWANPAIEKMFGQELKNLIGSSTRQHYPDEQAYIDFGQVAYPTLAAGKIFRTQRELMRSDGSRLWVDMSGTLLDRESGESLWVFLDVTEQHQAEDKLRKLSRIVEQAPMAVVITDLSGGVEYTNPWVSQVTGYSAEEMLGQNPRIFNSGLTPPTVHQDLWHTLAAGGVWRGEFQNRRKNGEIIAEQAIIAPVLDGSGRATHYVALKEDITQRKQAEEALQSSLRDKVALLNEVHHRVKNNLQVITSLLRLESARSSHPEAKSMLHDMQGRIRSMALLHELLYRSGSFASVDLGDYLRRLATQAYRAQSSVSGAVRLQLELASIKVSLDQATPCGLLVNELVSNGLKHGFPAGRNGEIRVQLQSLPAHDAGHASLQLQVSDTGVGLPEDFETRRGQSLGLQLVSDLARQLGGALLIGPGPGASFTVTFKLEEHRSAASST